MRTQIALLVAVLGLVCAQDQAAQPQTPQMAIMQVQQEEMMSQMYLDALLKMQHSSHNSIAARSFAEWGAIEHGKSNEAAQKRLLGAYHMMNAIIIRTKQIVFGASQIQQEFFADRVMQLTVQAAGNQVPPQVLQIVYMKQYASMLKTLKFSYALQVVSHFRTWLEDEIDVNADIVAEADNLAAVLEDQFDDLINDRAFAFQSYYMYTSLDMQLTFIDLYTQQMLHALMAPAQPPAQQAPDAAAAQPAAAAAAAAQSTAFLEEEATAQPSQFFAMMAQNPALMQNYMSMYKLWKVMFEFSAAQMAYSSSHMEQQILKGEGNTEELTKHAKQMFTGFAHNLMNAANIEYMMSLFSMYSFYAPAAGGAF